MRTIMDCVSREQVVKSGTHSAYAFNHELTSISDGDLDVKIRGSNRDVVTGKIEMEQKQETSLVVDLNLAGEEEAGDPRGEINLPLCGDLKGNADIPVEESDLPLSQRAGMDADSHALIPKKRPKENQVEKEGIFYVSDLVWGKVRSHPWWPGQIIEPSAASERAMKHFKNDSYLIAYFGDQTFAWNEASKLKPFRMYFSEMKEQSNADTFCDALDGALNEFSRRVEFGLACQCLPEDVLTKLKFQELVNAGIQDEPTRLYGGDSFSTACFFFPEKFMNYLKALAESPRSKYGLLELVTAKAQLLALNRFKGCYQLPVFEEVNGVSESNPDLHISPRDDNFDDPFMYDLGPREEYIATNGKRKLSSCCNEHRRKKRRQLLVLMSESSSSDPNSESRFQGEAGSKGTTLNSKKRKVIASVSSECRGTFGHRGLVVEHDGKFVNASNSGASTLTSENLYIGKISLEECPPMSEILLKLCCAAVSPLESYRSLTSLAGILGDFRNSISLETDTFQEEAVSSREREKKLSKTTKTCPPVSKILLKLCVAAANPLQVYRSLTRIAGILGNFRNSISLENNKSVTMSLSETKEKLSKGTEASEFVGTEDCYWTDRIIQNNSDKHVLFAPETTAKKVIPVSEGKGLKNIMDDKYEVGASKLDAEHIVHSANRNSGDYSPTTLVLNFSDLEAIPSIPNLNLIFHRFGPLEESRTTILTKSKRAKLIFKRRTDAECAFSRAGKFSIFGPSLVSYRLNYGPNMSSPTILTKSGKIIRHPKNPSEKEVS